MIHRKFTKIAVATLSTVALAAVIGITDGGTAVASPSVDVTVHTTNGHAPLFRSNGTLWGTLPLNDSVTVTCWYYGNPPSPWHGDGYQDHISWANGVGNFDGHIPDYYINLGGLVPPAYGIPKC
jgi:hypothetical protein